MLGPLQRLPAIGRRYHFWAPYGYGPETRKRNLSGILYTSSTCITLIGFIYAAVPFYRMFCQETGFAGTPKKTDDLSQDSLRPVPGAKPVTVSFVSDTSKNLPWKFSPEQKSVSVVPGQTALAFYSARNDGNREIIGMSTYSVVPAKAAQYFNKIQCFCFEEQRLGPGEQVDMPVFFYLDPEYAFDPSMDKVRDIVLGYTFFAAKE